MLSYFDLTVRAVQICEVFVHVYWHICDRPPQRGCRVGINFVKCSLSKTKESKRFPIKLIGGKKLKYHYLLQYILLAFVSGKLNDILFKKLMVTLQPICGGWSHFIL